MKSRKKNSKLPKWSIWLIILGFIINLIPVVLSAILFTVAINNEPIHKDLTIEKEPVISYNANNDTYTITGYIKNKSHNDYYYVDVVYKLYDKNGKLIGTAKDCLTEISDSSSIKFIAKYEGRNSGDISSYKLEMLKGV